MFAPYCPTCSAQVLLGPRRIVEADLSCRPMKLILRCFCGTAIPADNPIPAPAIAEPRVA
jgi:hypothetical protein